ncbi:unnamed protein product [Penicillium bialowiezense]
MAAAEQGHLVHPEGRTWKTHFPKGDLWVFGYGSLIWKPPPHYVDMCDDFGRLGASDHRGTHEKPGRVVTVIERSFWETLDDPLAQLESESASTGKVWGAAYHIPASHAEEVHDYLDEREINGYTAHYTPFHPTVDLGDSNASGDQASAPIICMVYIGQPSNSQFLREAASRDPQQVAEVISSSEGASGKNTEYLFMLEKALDGIGLGTADVHVTDLVKRVKAIEAEGLGDAEEKEAELHVTKSLEDAARDPEHADGRSAIE